MTSTALRPASLLAVAGAAVLFAGGIAAALALVALLPSSSADLTSGDLVLIGALVLSPTPLLSIVGYLRQLSVAADATVSGHAIVSLSAGCLFVAGWYPLTYGLWFALRPIERLGVGVLTEGAGFMASAAYWLLGPVLIPIGLSYLLRAQSRARREAA